MTSRAVLVAVGTTLTKFFFLNTSKHMPPVARPTQRTVNIPLSETVDSVTNPIYKFLSAASMVTISVSLAIIAAEIVRVTYMDDEGHYIMHIGTHEVH